MIKIFFVEHKPLYLNKIFCIFCLLRYNSQKKNAGIDLRESNVVPRSLLEEKQKETLAKDETIAVSKFYTIFLFKEFFSLFCMDFFMHVFLKFVFIYLYSFSYFNIFLKKVFFPFVPSLSGFVFLLVFVVSHVWIFLQSFLHSMHFSFNSLFFVFWFCFNIGVNLFLSDLKLNGICFVFHSLWDL